jgi:hypothetical protein
MLMHNIRTSSAAELTLAALLFVGAGPALSAQTIRGKVLEEGTNKPIPAATIVLLTDANTPAGKQATSDQAGAFVVTTNAPGVVRLRIEEPGYRAAVTPAVELQAGDDVAVMLHLEPDAIALAPIVVTANNPTNPRRSLGKLAGFHERMKRYPAGRFITREEIEKQRPFRVTDLLRTVPGLQFVERGLFSDVRSVNGCRPNVFLDGLRFPLRTESIDQIVNPTELEGIEVYPHSADAPAEFQTATNPCGAIVLWTRT